MTDYLAYWHIKGNAVPLQGQSLSCPFTHPFFEQSKKKIIWRGCFFIEKKNNKDKKEDPKKPKCNICFILEWRNQQIF